MQDTISRQQAIDALRTIATYKMYEGADMILIDQANAMTELMLLPPAEPKIIHCKDCKYGMLDPSFPHQWFCKFKGDEWNNGDYFCGHARKREATT